MGVVRVIAVCDRSDFVGVWSGALLHVIGHTLWECMVRGIASCDRSHFVGVDGPGHCFM